MRGLGLVVVAIGCGSPHPKDPPSSLPAWPPVVAAPTPVADAASADAAHALPHVVGTFPQRSGKTKEAWPSRVCVGGHELVFENDCGCNDKLVCELSAEQAMIHITLRLDPKQMKICDDCFAMIPARCALPAGGTTWTVEINGQVAFVLDRGAKSLDGSCWTVKP